MGRDVVEQDVTTKGESGWDRVKALFDVRFVQKQLFILDFNRTNLTCCWHLLLSSPKVLAKIIFDNSEFQCKGNLWLT